MFSDAALWRVAEELFCRAPAGDIREIGVHCYNLYNSTSDQLSLFSDELAREAFGYGQTARERRFAQLADLDHGDGAR